MVKINIDKKEIFKKEFNSILNLLNFSYKKMCKNSFQFSNFNEEKIRDILLFDYLKVDSYREKYNIYNLRFNKETEINKHKKNKVDIIIENLIEDYGNQDLHLIIECKKLYKNYNSESKLKKHYVSEGVERFEKEIYTSPFNKSIFVNFIIDYSCDWLNIIKSFFIKPLPIENNFLEMNSFKTKHKKNLEIYHLFMDFRKNKYNL